MYRARLICFSRQACGHAADYTDSPPGYNWSRNRAPGTREHGKYGISLSLSRIDEYLCLAAKGSFVREVAFLTQITFF